jgi:hypothetical protein
MWGLWWTKSHWGRFFSELSVSLCQFHSTGAPLLVKLGKKIVLLHHRVAQRALRLWCVRSICYGALYHVKKKKLPVECIYASVIYCCNLTNTTSVGSLLCKAVVFVFTLACNCKYCSTYSCLQHTVFIVFFMLKLNAVCHPGLLERKNWNKNVINFTVKTEMSVLPLFIPI